MDIQSKDLLPPSFTLYPLTTQDIKTCYESQAYKIICSINGPYYDRRYSELHPIFNVKINNSYCPAFNITEQQIMRIEKKIEQVLQTVMIEGRYQRMVFDINFQTIQLNQYNPSSFLLAPLLNLLSYTCALRSLETTGSFACTALILRNQKICWEYDQDGKKERERTLIMCNDNRDRKSLLTIYLGQFGYVEFQRLSSAAEQINLELIKFQSVKVAQVYELFNK